MQDDTDLDSEIARWAYRPGHKVENNPIFDRPIRPLAVLRWYRAYWLVISTTRLSILVALLAVWMWALTFAETVDLQFGWIGVIWLGFMIPHTVLGGGLRLWLVRLKGQCQTLKYDPRDQARNIGVYTFTLHPICSHSGFDGLMAAGQKRAQLGDFFHQLHHRYFECNYGTVEMPWDRWFGTLHDGSAGATTRTRAFKKQMYTK